MTAKYRSNLPQLSGDIFLTDGGFETNLMFNEGFDLPYLAAFNLLNDPSAQEAFQRWFHAHCQIAKINKVGFILDAQTWRASMDWATKLGYSKKGLVELIHKSVEMFSSFRHEYEDEDTKIVFSGCVGPRGDGYTPDKLMSVVEAEDYHSLLIETLSKTNADMISALTLNYIEEAVGIARAAKSFNMPAAISFTLETDGKLPTGQTLKDAIEQVEDETNQAPAYYMINCAHPTHFEDTVSTGEPWLQKIRGFRANSSTCSHAELDEAEELDDGNPEELGDQYRELRKKLPNLNVLGGCCGTDYRHIEAIVKACI